MRILITDAVRPGPLMEVVGDVMRPGATVRIQPAVPERVQHDDRHECGSEWVGGVCSGCGELCHCAACRRARLRADKGVKLMTADELEEQRRREENPFE